MKEQFGMRGHRDLEAWQASMRFVTTIYIASRKFPKDELFGMTSQIRRAVVCVASNIAEGYGRKSPREFRKFVNNAIGSLLEVETQLEIARNLDYLDSHAAAELLRECEKIVRLLNGLRNWTEAQIAREK